MQFFYNKILKRLLKVCMESMQKRWVYLPSESFSPESGGRVKPRTAIDAMRTQGTMRLKK